MAEGMWYLPWGIVFFLIICLGFLVLIQSRVLKKLREELGELRWLLEQSLSTHSLSGEARESSEGSELWPEKPTTDYSREGVLSDSREIRESRMPSFEALRGEQPTPPRRLYAWAVGISKGAKGPSAIGVVVKDPVGRSVARIKDRTGPLDRRNVVYRAVVESLKRALLEGAREVILFTNPLGGKPDLDPKPGLLIQQDIREELQELRKRFDNIEWILVERSKLREPEAIAKEALLPSGTRGVHEMRRAHGQAQK